MGPNGGDLKSLEDLYYTCWVFFNIVCWLENGLLEIVMRNDGEIK